MQGKKIFLASDHGGVELKNDLVAYLESKKYDVQDCGPTDARVSVDYPDTALQVIQSIHAQPDAVGILVCTTGIGMSMMANRFSFIRGALVMNEDMAKMSREHNNANVLVFGQKYLSKTQARNCVDVFLQTAFLGGRHARRVQKLTECGGKL